MVNRAQWIKQKRSTKLEDTKPERQWDDFARWAEIESSKVDMIDGVGNHIGSVKVGTEPTAIVWDQAKLSMYVVNFNPFGISGSLTVVKGLSHVRTISSYLGIYFSAYDEATDQVFVTDALGGVIIYT